MIWGVTSSFSKTFVFVRSHVKDKPAFSKISTQETGIEKLRLASKTTADGNDTTKGKKEETK